MDDMFRFDSTLDEYVRVAMPQYGEQLQRLVSIPSISAKPEHRPDLYRVLHEIAGIMRGYGFQTQLVETPVIGDEKPGNPVLVSHLEVNPAAPWITVYNHMDVQPADESEWLTKPFEPVVTNEKIIGRGATDDKGPALSILHAIHFLQSTGTLPVNVQVIYETGEETGSLDFGGFLTNNRELLRDPASILISDTIWEGDKPTLSYRLRGLAHASLRLRVGEKEGHSGLVGALALNPLNVLVSAAATCYDPRTGRVLIPGFYDGVSEPDERELDAIRETIGPDDLARFRQDTGRSILYTEDPLEAKRRLWTEPTFEIHGFDGGYNDKPGIKTTIPAAATVKVTMRVVPGQDPTRLIDLLRTYVQAYARSIHPDLNIEVTGDGSAACMTSLDNPFMERAAAACAYGYGKAPLHVGVGER